MIQDIYPLAPLQRGILFHSLASPETDVYLRQFVYGIHGSLDIEVFKAAWQQVISRHTSLRTSFVWEGIAECRQIVHDAADLPVTLEDWRGLDSVAQTEKLDSFLSRDRRLGLNLEQAPLMRFAAFRLADDEYRIVWTGHHLVFDGGSVGPLLMELASFYGGAQQGGIISLPQPRPYRDYIEWLMSQDVEKAEVFWRSELSDWSGPLSLPRISGIGTKEAGRVEQKLSLPKAVSLNLRKLAREQHLTLNTLLQGSWAIVLGRYGSTSDVVFGATLSVRPESLPESEGMIGLFINTLPVRVKIQSSEKLLLCLQRLQRKQAEARQYGYVSLVDITSWSGVEAGTSLFESVLVVENYGRSADPPVVATGSTTGGISIKPISDFGTSNYPLTVSVGMGADVIFRLNHDRNLFTAELTGQMLEHWKVLLEGITANPEERIGALPLLSAKEREQQLVEWNRTKRQYPQQCAHELFEEEARRRSEAIAVVHEEEQVSYEELNERANRLGRYLQAIGVRPEVRVGLCVERSVEMVVGILGVLKAGGAYVPMDPEYPVERQRYMMEDAAVRVLLTQRNLLERLPKDFVDGEASGDSRRKVVLLDEELDCVGRTDGKNFRSGVTPRNLAYILYTSGSTGHPKGVMIEHEQILNYFRGVRERTGVNEGIRYGMVQPLTVDSSQTVLMLGLGTGGELHVLGRDRSLDGIMMMAYMKEREIEFLKIAPSHLWSLQRWGMGPKENEREPKNAVLPQKCLVIGGEASDRDWAESLDEQGPGCAVYNHYGPTETTVGVLMYGVGQSNNEKRHDEEEKAEPGQRGARGLLPLGTPLGNIQTYILDDEMEVVPVGVLGELYIGGLGLARGYVNRPELTAERFVPDDLSGREGDRLYRTGDAVRYRRDGVIEFTGRKDKQVKVRGYRIELGEIEAALAQCPGVKQAVVEAWDVGKQVQGQEKQLVAYVVPSKDEAAIEQGTMTARLVSGYRNALAARLPEYMIPAQFVLLEDLPRTEHGKLDRKALQLMQQTDLLPAEIKIRPRNALETLVSQAWSDVLGIKVVGVKDDFFEAGGNSMKAMMLASRLGQVAGRSVPLKSIFEHRTVEGIASALWNEDKSTRYTSIVPIQPKGSGLPFFCIHPAGGLANSYLDLANCLGTEQPFYAIQAYGAEHGQVPFTSVEEMAQQYVKDIKEIQPIGPYQIGGWSLGCTIAFEVAQQLHRLGDEIPFLALLDGGCNTNPVDFLQDEWKQAIEKWIQDYLLRHPDLDLGADSEQFETAIQLLPPEQRYDYYLETAKSVDRIPPYIRVDEFRRFMNTYATNIKAARAYRPGPYPGKITLFITGSEEDGSRTAGWSDLALGGIEIYHQPGRHHDFIYDPHVRVLAENLRQCMRKAASEKCQPAVLSAGHSTT